MTGIKIINVSDPVLSVITHLWASPDRFPAEFEFLSQVHQSVRYDTLDAPAIVQLIDKVRFQQDFHKGQLDFKFEGNELYLWREELAIERLFLPPHDRIIQALEEILKKYQQAQLKGIAIDNGLLSFLTDVPHADRSILKQLAISQCPHVKDVADCWPLITVGIEVGRFPLEEIEACVAASREPWQGFGAAGEFYIEFRPDDQAEVKFLQVRHRCPLTALVDELKLLLRRFQAAI